MPYFAKLFSGFAFLVIQLLINTTVYAKSPLIAAASSLRIVMDKLEQEFLTTGGSKLRISFGSSGNLARQIAQGGPYELFLAADVSYIAPLVKAGRTKGNGIQYAKGRLALIARKNARFDVKAGLASLPASLKNKLLNRFAIANPEHAPYGRAAKQALTHAGIWQDIQPYLIFGENVAQTTQFATSSTRQAGLVSYSLALAPQIVKKNHHVLIPATWHAPLKHHMVLLKNASPQAKAFYTFMQTPKAQAILARYGFSPVAMR